MAIRKRSREGGHSWLMGLPRGGAGSEGGQEGPARPDICGDPVPGAAAAGAETFSAAGQAEHKCGWFIAPLGMSEPPPQSHLRGPRKPARPSGGRTSHIPGATLRSVLLGRAQPDSSFPVPPARAVPMVVLTCICPLF